MDHHIPIFLLHRHQQGISCRASIVDQNIQAPQIALHLLDQRCGLPGIADIRLVNPARSTARLNLFLHGVGSCCVVTVMHCHFGAAAGQFTGDSGTDPAAAARDQSDSI